MSFTASLSTVSAANAPINSCSPPRWLMRFLFDLTDLSGVPVYGTRLDLLALKKALYEPATFDPRPSRPSTKLSGGVFVEEAAINWRLKGEGQTRVGDCEGLAVS